MARQNTIEIIIKGEDRASGVLQKIGGHVQTVGKTALAGLGVFAGAAGAAGAALTKLAVDAAPLQGIQEAFEGIAEASGKSADEMLRALEKGSAGMIAQRDLMKSYNLAAQLVGDQFANQLPQAMGYLGKVAAATGEDMGFMMDSLVRGVGRLSPMILDNLGIQVDLAAANEAYAKTIGKTVSELTKQEQQTALMAQVMEKLAQNTANMPEVAGSAAAAIAGLSTKFQNFKDQAGVALLPVLTRVIELLSETADIVLPLVTPAIEALTGALMPLVDEFVFLVQIFVSALESGEGLAGALSSVAEELFNVLGVSKETSDKILGFISAAADLASQVASWVSSVVSWKDVLIALGIAIAAVVIPALYSVVAAIAPILAVGAALIAAIALIRSAWESNFLGIQDITQAVVGTVTELWQGVWEKAKVIWDAFWSGFQPSLDALYTRLQQFWTEIQPKLKEAWIALQVLWDQLVSLWNENVVPALQRLSAALGLGEGDTEKFWGTLGKLVGFLAEAELEGIITIITGAINAFIFGIETAIGVIDAFRAGLNAIRDALNSLGDVSIPDWLIPGSATPFEKGIRGITAAMSELSGMTGDMGLAMGGGTFAREGGTEGGAAGDQAIFNQMLAALRELVALGRENGVVVIEAGAGQGGRAREAVLGLGDQSWALMPG